MTKKKKGQGTPSRAKEAEKVPLADVSSTLQRYRLLARQPTAANITVSQPFTISPSNYPVVSMRPVHKDPAEQMQLGGTDIAIEYETTETDLLRATSVGLELIDDILAALSLYTSIRFGRTTPTQLLETTPKLTERRLLIPLQIGMDGSDRAIDSDAIDFARKAILHWDNLDTGHRLRRAARKYAQGLAEREPTDAFQLAYVGLEALEKPLAIQFGISPGVEVMTATCKSCGAISNYNRTTLAAVKKYVTGAHEGEPTKERLNDWKECSAVRNDLAHGLKDLSEIEGRAHRFLPAIFHYLYDASMHLAHAHELETEEYRFAWPQRFMMLGLIKNLEPGPLEDFELLLGVRPTGWAKDEKYGLVPEVVVNNSRPLDIGLMVRGLFKPLSDATENDLLRFVIKPMGRT